MRLNEIAEINTGIVLSRKQVSEGDYKYKMLTLKSIHSDGYIMSEFFDDVQTDDNSISLYTATYGDLVMRLSLPFTAVAMPESLGNVLIPSLFAVLRLRSNLILPEFLAYTLNSDLYKKEIAKFTQGSAVQVIRLSDIKELEIAVPPLAKQKAISQLNALMLRQKQLYQKLTEKQDLLNKAVINKILTTGVKNNVNTGKN